MAQKRWTLEPTGHAEPVVNQDRIRLEAMTFDQLKEEADEAEDSGLHVEPGSRKSKAVLVQALLDAYEDYQDQVADAHWDYARNCQVGHPDGEYC